MYNMLMFTLLFLWWPLLYLIHINGIEIIHSLLIFLVGLIEHWLSKTRYHLLKFFYSLNRRNYLDVQSKKYTVWFFVFLNTVNQTFLCVARWRKILSQLSRKLNAQYMWILNCRGLIPSLNFLTKLATYLKT